MCSLALQHLKTKVVQTACGACTIVSHAANLECSSRIWYQKLPVLKKNTATSKSGTVHASGACVEAVVGWALQSDALAAGQSFSAALCVPWLLQYTRSHEEQGKGSFPELEHFCLQQTPLAEPYAAVKSSGTNLCHDKCKHLWGHAQTDSKKNPLGSRKNSPWKEAQGICRKERLGRGLCAAIISDLPISKKRFGTWILSVCSPL